MRTGQQRRWAVGAYTDNELRIVALRVQGIAPKDIARQLGITGSAVRNRLVRVRRKAGLTSMAELTEWAKANALDVPLTPEPPAPRVPQKRGRKKIQMGRIRRARLKMA